MTGIQLSSSDLLLVGFMALVPWACILTFWLFEKTRRRR